MKIEQQKQEFRPVVITLESREEWRFLSEVLRNSYTGKELSAGAASFADAMLGQLYNQSTTN